MIISMKAEEKRIPGAKYNTAGEFVSLPLSNPSPCRSNSGLSRSLFQLLFLILKTQPAEPVIMGHFVSLIVPASVLQI